MKYKCHFCWIDNNFWFVRCRTCYLNRKYDEKAMEIYEANWCKNTL